MSPDRKMLDELRIDRPTASRRPVSAALIAGVAALVIVVAGVIWWIARPRAADVRTVIVQQPAAGGERTLLNASGYVTARREATVSSKVTGKVVEVLVEEGMKVEAGQVLARLDPSNAEQTLHLAEAQLESSRKALGETQANLEQAERELKRITTLREQGAAPQNEWDAADAEAKSLRARLERQKAEVVVAERELAQRKQDLDDTIIRAPFAGVVTTKDAQPGEMISPMSTGGSTRTGICTVVDMGSLEIEVDVSESYINRVEANQPVEATLDSYPQWKIPAKVIAIIPTADRQKATVKVRVGFEKLDPRILPDMSVKVAFRSGAATTLAQPSVTIPKSALQQRDGRDIVWVVADGRVERRAVTVDMISGDNATIAAGLAGGEHVVIQGPDNLADGARVTEAQR